MIEANIIALTTNHGIWLGNIPLSGMTLRSNVFHRNLFANVKFYLDGKDSAVDDTDMDALEASALEVDQALKSLGEHRGTITARYKQLRQAFIAWRTDAVAFRSTTEQDSKDIRDAFCNDYDWEKKVEEISNRYANDLKGKWDGLKSQQTRMLNEVDQLLNVSKDQSLPEFKRRIIRLLDSLEPVKDNELKGINNPKVRAHIDYGVAEHRSRQGSCAMKETYLSSEFCTNPNPKYTGSGCKLDCVKGCVVIEIKPNNTAEISKGGGQVDAYRVALHKIYGKQKATMFTGEFASLSRCVQSGDTLVLDARLETYAFCTSDPAQFFSLKEPVMDWTPPQEIN